MRWMYLLTFLLTLLLTKDLKPVAVYGAILYNSNYGTVSGYSFI